MLNKLLVLIIGASGFALFLFSAGLLLLPRKRAVTYVSFAFFLYLALVFILSSAVHSNFINTPDYIDPPIITWGGTLLFL
jgi:hypothetical protein